MRANMGTVDRAVRAIVVAPALIVAAVVVGPVSLLSILLYALAAVMLVTSAIAYCPLYAPLGMSTCPRNDTAARA
jgi:hypothetical protein